MSIRNFSKDPADILDYTFAFGPTPPNAVPYDLGWLMPGDALTGTPTITITGIDNALVVSTPPSISGQTVLFWLSGGTADTYTVACTCSTVQGRTVKKSITIDIRSG